MWQAGDAVEVRVPGDKEGPYGHLHLRKGVVQYIDPATGFVHVDLDGGVSLAQKTRPGRDDRERL